MRRCRRYVFVVVPVQGGRWGSQNIGRLRRDLGPNVDDRVLCHWQTLHSWRWDIWHLFPRPPSPAPTTRLPRRLTSGILFIRVVRFAECAVGLACCVFLVVWINQRSIGFVNGASFLTAGGAPRGRG